MSWRRFLYFRRRPLAAAFTFLAVLASLSALTPERDHGVAVLAASSELPAGTTLTRDHLAEVVLPADAVPEGAARAASDLVGRTLGAPVTRNTPLTTASVASGERLAQPGYVVVALPLPNDALAPLIGPGSRLDLIDSAGEAVATDVRVIASPDAAPGLGLATSDRAALVEVPPAVALRIAAGQSGGFTIALR